MLRSHQADVTARRLQLERTLAQRQADLKARTQELEDLMTKYSDAQKVCVCVGGGGVHVPNMLRVHGFRFVYSQLHAILGSIVVSISACHVEDPGSIPGRGAFFFFLPSTHYRPQSFLQRMSK